jgi:hypothetical protein
MSQSGLARISQGNLPPSVPLQFTGDNGSIAVPVANNININAGNAFVFSGSSVRFSNSGSTSSLFVTDINLNTLVGFQAGNLSITANGGNNNTSLGNNTLSSLTSGDNNVGIGSFAGNAITTGLDNVLLGNLSGRSIVSGSDNTIIGYSAATSITSDNNVIIGSTTAQSLTTGSSNIIIGFQSGVNYTGTESNNILIGNQGTALDSRVIRVGQLQLECFIAGIDGVTVANSELVTVDGSNQLGSISNGTLGQVLTSNGSASPTFQSISASGAVTTLTGDSGGALSPTAGNFNILGRSGSKVSGAVSTLTVKSPPFSQVGSSATSSLNTGEFVTAAVTRTLPASAGLADGDLFIYVCTTAGALVVQSVTAQKIRIGNVITSAAGSATSTAIGDSLTLRFNATDGFFYAVSVVGNWTLSP